MDTELIKAIQQLSDEEGITFGDACELAAKYIRAEAQKREQSSKHLKGADCSISGVKEC